MIKRELDDVGTDLKSGLYIAVYYDVIWRVETPALELFFLVSASTCLRSSVAENLN